MKLLHGASAKSGLSGNNNNGVSIRKWPGVKMFRLSGSVVSGHNGTILGSIRFELKLYPTLHMLNVNRPTHDANDVSTKCIFDSNRTPKFGLYGGLKCHCTLRLLNSRMALLPTLVTNGIFLLNFLYERNEIGAVVAVHVMANASVTDETWQCPKGMFCCHTYEYIKMNCFWSKTNENDYVCFVCGVGTETRCSAFECSIVISISSCKWPLRWSDATVWQISHELWWRCWFLSETLSAFSQLQLHCTATADGPKLLTGAR